MRILIVCFPFSLLAIAGCRKDASTAVVYPNNIDTALSSYFPNGRTVYLVGQAGSDIAYWTNGVKKVLQKNGRPTCMVFEEGTLLIGGLIYKNQTDQLAAYWENGEMHLLTDTLSSNIAAIHKWKSDIYACGHMFDRELNEPSPAQVHAVYWKNGDSAILSPESQASANDLAFLGNDMYVAGQINDGIKAVVWKNGTAEYFGDPGVIYGIQTSGSDIYFSGNFANPANGGYNRIRIFKNENPTATDSVISGGGKIVVFGSDIYIYGVIQDNTGHDQAAYWKNGVLTVLSTTHQSSTATGLVVIGNDVYAAGSFAVDGNETAVVWKNGQEIIVSTGANLVGIAVD